MIKKNNKKDHKYAQILQVNIASSSKEEVLNKIEEKLAFRYPSSLASKSKKFYIVTPNPEILVKAKNDPKLRKILNQADFSVPDGVGLKIFGDSRLSIYPGRKLMIDICLIGNMYKSKVFLLGGSAISNMTAVKRLAIMYPNLKVEGDAGAKYDENANPVSEVDLKSHFDTVKKINSFAPNIIFVALGCPKQEYWIDKYLPILKTNGAMTVGGAIDYLSGEASLPPQIFENLGLEWLWRLLSEPERWRRILTAFFVFPWTIFTSKLKTYLKLNS